MDPYFESGTERDTWVMVDEDGRQTLFRLVELVEVGGSDEMTRLIKEFRSPVVMIDVAVPRLRGPEATPGPSTGPARGRLVVLSLHMVNDDDDAGDLVAYRRLWES